jgi:hypothetical protein
LRQAKDSVQTPLIKRRHGQWAIRMERIKQLVSHGNALMVFSVSAFGPELLPL